MTYSYGNVSLSYEITGQGPTLLFLHGIGVSTRSYRKAIELLSTKYRVISPDLPGFGRSGIPDKVWGYEDYANFLNGFLGGIREHNVAAVGHSFGGEIALRMAAANPGIKKLVIIGASGYPVEKSVLQLLWIMLVTKPRTNLALYRNPKQLATSRTDVVSNIFRKLPHAWRLARTILKCIYHPWNMPGTLNTEAQVIWDTHDEVISLEAAQRLMNHLPNGKLVQIDEHHDWVQFRPEILMDILAKN